jgi:ubiquinol-cytochrome c reductase cytochrome b subunit
MSTPPLVTSAVDWIDSRTGIRSILSNLLDEPIPGGSRWAYVFGSALLATLLNQFVTGVLLSVYYVPSVDHAHTTVAYIQKVVPLGWLVRGLHYYGASAVIVILLLHLAQVFIWGAYKQRREAVWLVGVILLNILLGFGFTGYLLPWDQKAYYGTQVAAGIAGSIPLLGETIATIVLGGTGLGQATLSRFFTAHVFLLPAAIVALTVAHLYFFRIQGPAGPASDTPPPPEKTERFYPGQFFKDTVVGVALLVLFADLAFSFPAPLGPMADPAASFVPRPEWYFLWAFQLLRVIPAFAGAVVLPGVLMTLLALAPFIDRSPYRSIRRRKIPIAIFVVVMATLAGLTGYALFQDKQDPLIEAQEKAMERFMEEPFVPDTIGKPPEESASGAAQASTAKAPSAYVANCAGCHGDAAQGQIGPALLGVSTKPKREVDDLIGIIHKPESYGLKGMPGFADMSEADARAIAEWLAKTTK